MTGRHGWLVIDKPEGITSNRVVDDRPPRDRRQDRACRHARPACHAACCRSRSARRPRPCASPPQAESAIASRVRWGIATDTDDSEGTSSPRAPLGQSARRSRRCCRASSARSSSARRPYSALKVGGDRAYELARAGKPPELAVRPVEIARARADRAPRPRSCRFHGRGRRRHLYPRPRPRPRRGARHARPCHRAAPHSRSAASPKPRRFRWIC